jgi:hypothetical protein
MGKEQQLETALLQKFTKTAALHKKKSRRLPVDMVDIIKVSNRLKNPN